MVSTERKKQLKITVVGGGTGLSTLLRGLKQFTSDLTAIVTVTDDGGSSGKLRRELGVLPPGDIRSCLVALSEEETLMSQLFNYRFPMSGSLSGHSFGNLFLTAMSAVAGGFDSGIARSSEVLAIRGKVLPVTLESVSLSAQLIDGRVANGESAISRSKSAIKKLTISPSSPAAGPQVIESILKTDAVIIGPGSLYTSIAANFLVRNVSEAIKRTKAPVIYVANLMTQPGETSGYSLSRHVETIERYIGRGIIDYIVTNSKKIPGSLFKKYARKGSFLVSIDKAEFRGAKIVKGNIASSKNFIRHDSASLANLIMKLLRKG